MPNLETLARFAPANLDTDRALLALHMEAAQLYLEGAGVAPREDNALYDQAVYMLATHYLDNKGVVAEGGVAEIPMGVTSIMHQLRLEDVTEDLTEEAGEGGEDP